ncbi:MAG: amidohydrolase family protein [Erysipelotrichaceae bacterium]|nr:amidohydrolase family protein [Erysipelotrichaceae bacterium]MCI9311728.1 amidohydrolase family protein [Erysipelotrichaceae bacterium]
MLHLTHATIYTMSDAHVIEDGDVLIENGKIKAVGPHLEAPDCEVIDCRGKVIIPGIIDAHSHVGTFNIKNGEQDANEMTNPNTAQLDVYYGIDANSPSFADCVRDGITTSIIAPGSGNAIGGLVLALKSAGKNYDARIVKRPCALKAAMGVNPKGVYGPREQLPMSRLGVAQIFLDYFENVKEYMRKKEEANGDKEKMPPYNEAYEHGQLVLERKIPLKVHSYQHDMMALLRWKEQYGFDLTLDHAFGASDFYDEIAASGAQIIWGPLSGPLFGGEGCKADPECVIELDKRGVTCAIMTDGPVLHPYMILTEAGEIVRRGADVETALKMITLNAAKIARAADRIGSIECGKDADLVVFDKTPALDTDAKVLLTIIDGEIVYRNEA